jgi:hypothetical protein
LASLVSIIGTIQWGRCDHPFSGISLEYMTNPELSAGRFNAVIDQLEAGVVPPGQVCNVLYKDLVADTIGTVESIYRQFGIELTEDGRRALAQYMDHNPRDNRPPHRFSIGSDEAVARARAAFGRYSDCFGVPTE